jgi:hypothetical protein
MSKFQLNEFAEEVQKEYQKKVEEALKRAEKILDKKIQLIINALMIKDYYEGYFPVEYHRTWQLPKSVAPYVGIGNEGGTFGITIGIDDEAPYGPDAMDHAYISKKSTKKAGRNAKREEIIFEYFLAGIHPRVGRAGTSWVEREVNDALDDLFDNELEDIVYKELDKIK